MANEPTTESILNLISEFNVVTAISKKNDKPYRILEVKTKGGVETRFFIDYRDMRDLEKEIDEQTKKDSKFNLND